MATTSISRAPVSGHAEPPRSRASVPVDEHIQIPAPLAPLVKEKVGNGQRPQRLPHRRCLDVEAPPALSLVGKDTRDNYLDHCVTSTDRIGGRCRPASTHTSPSASAKKEPLWVPKYSESASEADASRSTAAQAGLGRPSDISSHVCPLSRVR